MKTVDSIAQVRGCVTEWRRTQQRVAFVATMGNLHAGHLSLVSSAAQLADRVIVSIFVNPLQFGAGEDFHSYPRTLAEDRRALEQAGVALLFSPSLEEMFPDGQPLATQVQVHGLADDLCGVMRPGHFVGMATIVTKLLSIVQPHVAVFGQKDYQQLVIIRRLVRDLNLPVAIEEVATEREADGLAMSSRNQYLTAKERARAPALFAALTEVARALHGKAAQFEVLVAAAEERLRSAGFEPEYLQIRRAGDLAVPSAADPELVVLAAARLGKARLIDNVRVSR